MHSLVVVGRRMHEMEIDFMRDFAVNGETFDRAVKALTASAKDGITA